MSTFAAALSEARYFDIWVEGWAANEGRTPAHCVARRIKANSFQEACDLHYDTSRVLPDPDYDRKRLTHWGCRLFDNEKAARKAFG